MLNFFSIWCNRTCSVLSTELTSIIRCCVFTFWHACMPSRVCVCVFTFMPVCSKSVSTLAASCAPPSNPLSPSWISPLLLPTPFQICSWCQRDSCTTEDSVLGTEPRRRAKAAAALLLLYHRCYSSLLCPSTVVWCRLGGASSSVSSSQPGPL